MKPPHVYQTTIQTLLVLVALVNIPEFLQKDWPKSHSSRWLTITTEAILFLATISSWFLLSAALYSAAFFNDCSSSVACFTYIAGTICLLMGLVWIIHGLASLWMTRTYVRGKEEQMKKWLSEAAEE